MYIFHIGILTVIHAKWFQRFSFLPTTTVGKKLWGKRGTTTWTGRSSGLPWASRAGGGAASGLAR